MSTKRASPATPKRRLLVIAGAGSAIDFGMPSVSCVNQICKNAAAQYFSLVHDLSSNLYTYMYDEVKRYWDAHVPRYPKTPNFEDILYALYVLGSTFPAGRFTSAFGAFVTRKGFPDVVHIATPSLVDKHVFGHLSQHLLNSLLDDFRTRCRECPPNFAALKVFFSALCDEFNVAVVTTNYDDLIYRALPPDGRETGFNPDDGSFKPERILHRAGWPCILHLHGSVHFDMRTDESRGELHRISWEGDLTRCQQNSMRGYPGVSTEGHWFPTSSIIAGYGKTQQIQHLPFRIYYSELDRLVYESDMVLFLGYGFGDTHLTEAFSDYRDSRNRRVVIIDYTDDTTLTAGSNNNGEGCLRAAREAMRILKTHHYQMRWLGYRVPGNVKSLREQMEFERSIDPSRQLSLWYNGMLTACQNAAKIVNELSK
jgi:SIR2-like domain